MEKFWEWWYKIEFMLKDGATKNLFYITIIKFTTWVIPGIWGIPLISLYLRSLFNSSSFSIYINLLSSNWTYCCSNCTQKYISFVRDSLLKNRTGTEKLFTSRTFTKGRNFSIKIHFFKVEFFFFFMQNLLVSGCKTTS